MFLHFLHHLHLKVLIRSLFLVPFCMSLYFFSFPHIYLFIFSLYFPFVGKRSKLNHCNYLFRLVVNGCCFRVKCFSCLLVGAWLKIVFKISLIALYLLYLNFICRKDGNLIYSYLNSIRQIKALSLLIRKNCSIISKLLK